MSVTKGSAPNGFRDGAHVYRLVAWGLFLGDAYLEELRDGELAAISSLEAPEAERFKRIRALITSPGYAVGTSGITGKGL